MLRELIDSGSDINSRDESGQTLLMIASGYGYSDIVEFLIDRGADVFTKDCIAGATALHKACQGGHLDIVKLLVEKGNAFINDTVNITGHTALFEAIWYKQVDIVEYLLKQPLVNLNIKTNYGFSLQEHIKYGISVNQKPSELQKFKQMQNLVELKEQQIEQIKNNPIFKAVLSNDAVTVKSLLEVGEYVNIRYPIEGGFNDYHTLLLIACRENCEAVAVELLKYNADVNAVEPTFGAVSLHKATYNGHANIVKLLLKQKNIDINYQGASNGYTPLHDALWHGFEECANLLIDAGANLEVVGHDGKKPIDIAIEVFGENSNIVRKIMQK